MVLFFIFAVIMLFIFNVINICENTSFHSWLHKSVKDGNIHAENEDVCKDDVGMFTLNMLVTMLAFLYICSGYKNNAYAAAALLVINLLDQPFTKITKQKSILKYIFLGFYGYWVLSFMVFYDYGLIDVLISALVVGCFGFFAASASNFAFGYVFVVIATFSLRLGAMLLGQYRLGGVTIHDIFSIPTALTIASSYNISLSWKMWLILILSLILFLPIYKDIPSTEFESKKKKWITVAASLILCFASVMGCGCYTRTYATIKFNASVNAIETLTASIVDECILLVTPVDKEKAVAEINQFEDDEKSEVQPNIICILSESYADIPKLIPMTTSRDAYASFYGLESNNCAIGEVNVDIFGGGTARSEWEVLTGLDIGKYSKSQIPFLSKCNDNYAFTANDSLYGDYEKTVIHPFGINGWNRKNVYENFDYDNFIFREYQGMQDAEYVHGFVSDDYVYELIKNQIEDKDSPQFINTITIQNHGGYEGIELENEIKVEENLEYKEEIEGVLSLHEKSSKAIANFIQYLDEHKENPTLVVYYGDHYPGGLFESDSDEAYVTPYLVYSNFCELTDMPERLDLSLLYPYAKAAAGLPLTAYEKYLISLDGETADLNMILSKMNGYVD